MLPPVNCPSIWLVGVVLVVALSLGRFAAGPLTGDDDYVLHNLASSNLRDVLFAFNVDLVKGEGGETVWYEGFDTLQRRYVRVVPSGLMAIEYRLFGSNPIGFKTVSLLVHLLNLVLGYGLLRRQLADPVTAAAIVALLGSAPRGGGVRRVDRVSADPGGGARIASRRRGAVEVARRGHGRRARPRPGRGQLGLQPPEAAARQALAGTPPWRSKRAAVPRSPAGPVRRRRCSPWRCSRSSHAWARAPCLPLIQRTLPSRFGIAPARR